MHSIQLQHYMGAVESALHCNCGGRQFEGAPSGLADTASPRFSIGHQSYLALAACRATAVARAMARQVFVSNWQTVGLGINVLRGGIAL